MKQLIRHEGMRCANCGAVLEGEFCHECGQSFHSVLKPMHHMAEETVETLLHIDGRIVHTLPPLLLRPGFLTLEYFSGRRVRYVAPFRLVFVLCLLAFFVCHLRLEDSHIDLGPNTQLHATDNSFNAATTPAAVELALQQQLAGLERAQDALGPLGGLAASDLTVAKNAARQQAAQRIQVLEAAPAAGTALQPSDSLPTAADAEVHTKISNDWLNSPSHIEIAWLPGFANDRVSKSVSHLKANLRAMESPGASRQEAFDRLLTNFFGMLPQTMFVMIPLFALLLKLFYVFRRRLYMEHLIVALHSHAYLFFSLLLGVSFGALSSWLAPHAAWVTYPLHWLEWGLALWIPAYLLIMQKRIYRQGWPMTLLKFGCIGFCYFWLLTLALLVAGALGMAK
ncbi:DUF3667 domain-containing protein [Rhodanobacter sp. AS-Z3]|nr:DUF3667 domain-containing protein [Rhodanobacter sp. AS-Z3]WEN16816.1 DUF3667 domain-containing protein [Rhodanobacter sp. AS-Z3]